MLADVMTKGPGHLKFEKHVGQIRRKPVQAFAEPMTDGGYVSTTEQENYFISNSTLIAVTGKGWR